MATRTNIVSEQIVINFGWKGPSSGRGGLSNGGLDIGVVDLIFKNAKTDISVHIPESISPTTVQKFPFTCRRYQEKESEISGYKFKPLSKETHPNLLQVTVEQIHNLTLKAGVFEKSPHKGAAVMDGSGTITHEKRILRSDREVKLKIPHELEIGQTYTLVVTSNDLSLTACLVKEEKPIITTPVSKKEDSQLIQDQTELFQLLGGVLLPLMNMKVMEFGIKLMTISSGSRVNIDSNSGEQTLGIEAIKKEIGKIEKNALKDLMIKIRALKAEWENKSFAERNILEKEAIKACFNLIGTNGLMSIMSSNLTMLVQGNITNEIQLAINSIAERFKEICIKHVT